MGVRKGSISLPKYNNWTQNSRLSPQNLIKNSMINQIIFKVIFDLCVNLLMVKSGNPAHEKNVSFPRTDHNINSQASFHAKIEVGISGVWEEWTRPLSYYIKNCVLVYKQHLRHYIIYLLHYYKVTQNSNNYLFENLSVYYPRRSRHY